MTESFLDKMALRDSQLSTAPPSFAFSPAKVEYYFRPAYLLLNLTEIGCMGTGFMRFRI
jgi:hypothetical protein